MEEENEEKLSEKIINLLGVLSFVVAAVLYFNNNENYFSFILYAASYVLLGYEIIWNACKKLFKKDMFDENFLMCVATIGAFAIGEYNEAILVLLLYKIGEYLQDKAVENSKKKIEKTLDLRPEFANLKTGEKIEKVSPEVVSVGNIIVIKNGERVPLDGVSLGKTTLDTSAITGESKPQNIFENDVVLSGAINLGETFEMKVTSEFESSTVSKIVKLIDEASTKKSNTEKFITRFAKIYTPIVTLLAVVIMIVLPVVFKVPVGEAISRGLNFLVVSCPCALVISVPLGFFVGIGTCSKNGILVKGSKYIDIATKLDDVVFDKTGTLTKGNFKISEVKVNSKNYTEDEMLRKLYLAESLSNHYIAKSVVESLNKSQRSNQKILSHKEIAGNGIVCKTSSEEILVGNSKLMEKYEIKHEDISASTVIHIAVNSEYIGYVVMEDEIKDDTLTLSQNLKKYGIKDAILLTGDKKNIAEKISERLKFDKVYSELLPDEKSKIIENLKSDGKKVAFVGDGINDGPVIATSDVGIAMGKGSDIAVETSDVVLMNDEPQKVVDFIKIAKRTKMIVTENITVVLLVKIVFLILSAFGISRMWEAIFADVGISLLAVINCFRINLKK